MAVTSYGARPAARRYCRRLVMATAARPLVIAATKEREQKEEEERERLKAMAQEEKELIKAQKDAEMKARAEVSTSNHS